MKPSRFNPKLPGSMVAFVVGFALSATFAIAQPIVVGSVAGQPGSFSTVTATGTVTGTRFLSSLTGDTGVTHGMSSALGVGFDTGAQNVYFYNNSAIQWFVAGATGDLSTSISRNVSTGGNFRASSGGGFQLGTNTFMRNTAPTISGFGTSPSVVASNGTAAFTINVGTGGTANTGTITLPAATTGWVCHCEDVTTPASFVVGLTGGTTTTCTISSYSRTTGSLTAWTASDILRCTAVGY